MDEESKERETERVSSIISDFDNRCNKRPQKYGLCANCNRFHYIKTKLDSEIALCSKFKKYLSTLDVVTYCTDFYPFDQMDVWDMMKIAHFIEIKNDKKVGF